MIVKSVMTQAHTHREPCESEEWENELVKKCQKLTPTHHTSMFVHLVRNMLTSWVFPPKYFTAKRHDSGMPKQRVPCYHFIITPPSSVLANTSAASLYLHTFYSDVHLSEQKCDARSCSHVHTVTQSSSTYTQYSHWGYTPTNVTFNGHSLSRKLMRTYNTLLHREACCVLSGGTQMAATWCVLMGSCDGFGQDMLSHTHTHTDGDPLRVAERWTCWLLICPDQWFTTWSSDTGGVAPTELAQWLAIFGTHHSIYAGYKSTKFYSTLSFPEIYFYIPVQMELNSFYVSLMS